MLDFGVEDGTKTHRLYDPQHKKIHVRRGGTRQRPRKYIVNAQQVHTCHHR